MPDSTSSCPDEESALRWDAIRFRIAGNEFSFREAAADEAPARREALVNEL